jgi:hypothetical protein
MVMIFFIFLTLHLLPICQSERTPVESAVLARQLLNKSKLSNLATVMASKGPKPDLDGIFFLLL